MSAACLPETSTDSPSIPALANIFAAPDASGDVTRPAYYAAWLDHTDRIVHVSPTWDGAMAPEFRSREVLARPIGWFVGDANLRECYRALLARVRGEHRGAKLVARCDQAVPRAMQLSVVPLSAGAIELMWSFLEGSAALRIKPVPHHHFNDGDLLRMCGWCHNVNLGPGWQRLEDASAALGLLGNSTLPAITHGICPGCSGAMASEFAMHRSLQVAV